MSSTIVCKCYFADIIKFIKSHLKKLYVAAAILLVKVHAGHRRAVPMIFVNLRNDTVPFQLTASVIDIASHDKNRCRGSDLSVTPLSMKIF